MNVHGCKVATGSSQLKPVSAGVGPQVKVALSSCHHQRTAGLCLPTPWGAARATQPCSPRMHVSCLSSSHRLRRHAAIFLADRLCCFCFPALESSYSCTHARRAAACCQATSGAVKLSSSDVTCAFCLAALQRSHSCTAPQPARPTARKSAYKMRFASVQAAFTHISSHERRCQAVILRCDLLLLLGRP